MVPPCGGTRSLGTVKVKVNFTLEQAMKALRGVEI
jgi:hypothetical protein